MCTWGACAVCVYMGCVGCVYVECIWGVCMYMGCGGCTCGVCGVCVCGVHVWGVHRVRVWGVCTFGVWGVHVGSLCGERVGSMWGTYMGSVWGTCERCVRGARAGAGRVWADRCCTPARVIAWPAPPGPCPLLGHHLWSLHDRVPVTPPLPAAASSRFPGPVCHVAGGSDPAQQEPGGAWPHPWPREGRTRSPVGGEGAGGTAAGALVLPRLPHSGHSSEDDNVSHTPRWIPCGKNLPGPPRSPLLSGFQIPEAQPLSPMSAQTVVPLPPTGLWSFLF